MQVQPELVRLEHENRSGRGLDRLTVEAAITVEEAMISRDRERRDPHGVFEALTVAVAGAYYYGRTRGAG
jgi:hypothetical protein